MDSVAHQLARWAVELEPTPEDHQLAARALTDTVAVTVAARKHPIRRIADGLPDATRWATVAHVLDFDDLHMESTTHVSVVCVPAVLAAGGGARAYLAAAGVMARLGMALGWPHYSAGWHATCTAGAPAAAAGAGTALGLSATQIATAMALAIPAAGGLQRAFGTDGKSLQVGFAVEAGVRAARLAAAGATADTDAVGQWLELVGGNPGAIDPGGPAVPGGLGIKLFPCCYALQRPISTLAELAGQVDPTDVTRIVLRTPQSTVVPLVHHQPATGLEGKFSLEYAAATALLDRHQGLNSFTDEAVRRPEAQRLGNLVDVQLTQGGTGLLDGELEAEIHANGEVLAGRTQYPPGSPKRPPTGTQLTSKVNDCLTGTGLDPQSIDWSSAGEILRCYT
ncbi:MmgE/PrpD family protein [Streptomyces sp. NPDC059718]